LAATSGTDATEVMDAALLAALQVEAVLDQPPSSEMDEESGSKRAGRGAPPPPFAACLRFLYGSRLASLAADFLPDAFADVTGEAPCVPRLLSAAVRPRPCNLGAETLGSLCESRRPALSTIAACLRLGRAGSSFSRRPFSMQS